MLCAIMLYNLDHVADPDTSIRIQPLPRCVGVGSNQWLRHVRRLADATGQPGPCGVVKENDGEPGDDRTGMIGNDAAWEISLVLERPICVSQRSSLRPSLALCALVVLTSLIWAIMPASSPRS
ncbi:hypothetical protein BDZ85DRAFT_66062 [Elsinoe ampelina]|uniref:Uncharacterized protein n=1 Tax=Elsinoe ampelina TaxID=302913 RepID=A0A6A6GIC2_9PEZI|nr:hypothetical protein BDZ85DRAFT_66062 [Elsinoe ampelina]